MRLIYSILAAFLSVTLTACSDNESVPAEEEAPQAAEATAEAPAAALEVAQLETILEVKGIEQNGQYKVALPQNELAVSVDGFRIVPPMGLTSWAAFAPAPEGAVVMGDLVLQEDEIAPVEKTLIDSGLTVSGLHNHFVRDRPKVMFMHIHGTGPGENLARGVQATLDRIEELRTAKNLQEPADEAGTTFDPETIESILEHSGEMNSGVFKITIGRPDVQLTDHAAAVTSFMGFNTWMAFQGTAEEAAVSGDFAMLEHEVAPVIRALVENDIEVVAVHNHMVTEQPRIFFLHFWGVGPVESLAMGLKAGLDQTGSGTVEDASLNMKSRRLLASFD